MINHPSDPFLLLVFLRQHFLVGHGPFGLDPTGCWPVISSCSPCRWLKKSRSSPCGCAPFSCVWVPVCLQRAKRIGISFITKHFKTGLQRVFLRLEKKTSSQSDKLLHGRHLAKKGSICCDKPFKKASRLLLAWMEQKPRLTSLNKSISVKKTSFQKGLVIKISSVADANSENAKQ